MPNASEQSNPRSRVLCTPDDFARSSLLYVQEVGELAPAHPQERARAGHASFLFLCVESGDGRIREGSTSMSLRAGECALIDCRRGYGHSTGSPPWHLFWIHFHGHAAPAIHAHWRELSGSPVVRATNPGRYLDIWRRVWNAARAEGATAALKANEALAALFALLAEDAAEPDLRADRLASLHDWIEEHCAEDISLDRLASVAALNKFTLSREFHSLFGIPPSKAVAMARVARAKRLLRFTDDTVESIGEACGVQDPNYFARLFRRIEGVSPSAFRRQWRGGVNI